MASSVARKDFPRDFMFGCSTCALQTEGAGDEGGRGPSTWDYKIQDNHPGKNIAADSYHLYREDVQLLKNMGTNSYRFSISWSRILPGGIGKINQEGIDFYNNLIDELIANGITPMATLLHFDLPQALQDDAAYDGFFGRKTVDAFLDYADICFKNFGDRVQHWVTINEPQMYGTECAPSPATAYLLTHNLILAHAAVARHYKKHYQSWQRGEIGITTAIMWFEPYENVVVHIEAARRALDFWGGWLLSPLVYGDYPFSMKSLVRQRLPEFTDDEKSGIKGSADFIGISYYTSRYAKSLPISQDDIIFLTFQYMYAEPKVERNGKLIGEKAPAGDTVYVYPRGLTELLLYFKEEYENPKIYVTENGYPEERNDYIPIEYALMDNDRIKYIRAHLHAISEAMKKGANVKGYFMWSLMDCWEPGSGYQVRMGLNYTDYHDNLKRIPKRSAQWFRSWVEGHDQ